MTVFVEYAFFSNFVFDFLLLYCTVKLMKIDFRKVRLFLSDLLGSIVAVALPLFDLGLFALPAKLALSVAMIAVLASYGGKKQFFAALLLFWGLTFALGGVLCGVYFLTGQDFAVQSDLAVVSTSPLPLFAGGVLLFAFLMRALAAYICNKRSANKFIFDVTLVLDGKKLKLKGFFDSGNRLVDPNSGMPVCIAVSDRLLKRLKSFAAEKIVAKGDVHCINFVTPAGKKKMTVVGADGFFVEGKEVTAALGIADAPCAAEWDLLLNGALEL